MSISALIRRNSITLTETRDNLLTSPQIKPKGKIKLIVQPSKNLIRNNVSTCFPGRTLSLLRRETNQIQAKSAKRFKLVILSDQVWFPLPTELKLSKYLISKDGRIKNRFGRISTVNPEGSGYVRSSLWTDEDKRVKYSIHRLVAMTFIPNPNNKESVDHINQIRYDNRVENLRWVTPNENALNRSPSARPIQTKRVMQISMVGAAVIKIWPSVKNAAENLGVVRTAITNACRSGTKCQGFLWRYYVEQIEGEEWKELCIANTTIKVSSCGRIEHPPGRITYGTKHCSGYYRVTVNKKAKYVQCLVCQAFNPIPDSTNLQVNHKDKNKENNNILNLEWCTRRENMQHDARTPNRDRRRMSACRKVRQLKLNGKFVAEFYSAAEASRQTNICVAGIRSVCRRERNMAGMYRWEYC